jgi:hypothetical protein
MATYFFDFLASDVYAVDDEGLELTDVDAAHASALQALADALEHAVAQGLADQRLTVHVRDDLGPVLDITAVVDSKFLRKQ